MDVGGFRNEVSLSEVAQWGEPVGRALLGTPKDMLGLLFLAAKGY
jgi:hypothetical protein